MDLSFLPGLQQLFCMLPGPAVEPVILFFERFAIGTGSFMIVFLIYWCIDKKTGARLFGSIASAGLFGSLVLPGNPLVTAGSLYEGIARFFIRHPRIRLVCRCFPPVLALAGCLLGLYGPLDVIAGLACAWLFLWAGKKLQNAFHAHGEPDIAVFLAAMAAAGAVFALLMKAPSPFGYRGTAFLHGSGFNETVFHALGLYTGFVISWFLDRRVLHFDTEETPIGMRFLRILLGPILTGLSCLAAAVITTDMEAGLSHFMEGCFLAVCVFLIIPFLFMQIEGCLEHIVNADLTEEELSGRVSLPDKHS